MTVFVLKLIAVLSMVTDHISYMLTLALRMNSPLLFNMRALGRIAFPVYAFLLVNGFEKTRDKRAYLARLFLFALISHIPFSLVFSQQNYMTSSMATGSHILFTPLWQFDVPLLLFILLVLFLVLYRKSLQRELIFIAAALCVPLLYVEVSGIVVLGWQLNVFYTLAVSFAVVWALDILTEKRKSLSPFELLLVTAACIALAAYILPDSDYGFRGLMLIAALYLARRHKIAQLVVSALWACWMYSYSNVFLLGALAACLPIALYSGKLGKKMRLGFYLVYPVHLTVLFFVGLILN